jgi:hypothetical protein
LAREEPLLDRLHHGEKLTFASPNELAAHHVGAPHILGANHDENAERWEYADNERRRRWAYKVE